MFGYDEEVPAGFQDADFEMREMEEVGRQMTAQRKRGVCQHASAVGFTGTVNYPEQEGLRTGELRCTEGCARVFADQDAWFDAMESARFGK